MALDITREELRSDILEITTAVVDKALKENNRKLIRMFNEDLMATNNRIDTQGHSMDKRFKAVDQQLEEMAQSITQTNEKIDFTHKLLHVHVANPSAHARRTA